MAQRAPSRHLTHGGIRKVLRSLPDRASVDESGFGIIEVLVAVVILLVVLLPASYLMDSVVQQTASAREKVAATELADEALEQLSNDSLTTLEGVLDQNYSLGTTKVASTTYTTTGYLTWQGTGNVPDLCQSGSPPQTISATATVSWGSGLNKQQLAEQSVIAPQYGLPVFYLNVALTKNQSGITIITATTAQTIAPNAYVTIGAESSESQVVQVTSAGATNTTAIPVDSFTSKSAYAVGTAVSLPNEGYLAVQVNGVTGSAPADISQVTVQIQSTATGSTAATYAPDSNGCVFAQELPGTYNVTLGSTSTPPFIATSDNQSTGKAPTTTTALAVSAGVTTTSAWTFDQAASVSFTPIGGVPAAAGLPVSVLNSGIPGTDWETVIPALSSATSAYLYPFASTYSVWYGDCLVEDPSPTPTVAVTPGGTATVPMTGLSPLTVQPETSTGAVNPGSSVTATVQDSADGCNADMLTLPSSSLTAPNNTEAGVIEATRQDATATWANGVSIVNDTAITPGDVGKEAIGAGIPIPAYVGSVVSGTSFTLYSTPVVASQTSATIVTTTSGNMSGSVSLVIETYAITVTGALDNKTQAVSATVTPGGVVCTSGCTPATSNVLEPTGTPIKVEVP